MIRLQHAPAGGIEKFGHVYRGGQLLPFYIPRAVMPQVDEVDLPDLIDWVRCQGIAIDCCSFQPDRVQPHQRVEMLKAITMPEEALRKPVLTSADRYIIDGHHRWMAHLLHGTAMPALVIEVPFEDALNLIFEFPRTYSYGDGNFHPITN